MPIIKRNFDDFNGNANDASKPAIKKRKLNHGNTSSVNKSSKKAVKKPNKKSTKKSKKSNEIHNSMDLQAFLDDDPITHDLNELSIDELPKMFEKICLGTLKISENDLNIEFNKSHFIKIDSMDKKLNRLKNLDNFLNNYYQTLPKYKENKKNTRNKVCNEDRKKWIPLTKTFQTLIISSSAKECVNISKQIRNIRTLHNNKYMGKSNKNKDTNDEDNIIGLRIALLFGKHKKINEQINDLKTKSYHCGIGNINRIKKLFGMYYVSIIMDIICISINIYYFYIKNRFKCDYIE